MKYVLWAIVILIIVLGGFYWWSTSQNNSAPPPTTTTTTTTTGPTTLTYATSTFSISYPSDYTVDESYQYTGVPNKPINGVKFTIPGSMATGTNLSTDSGVSVEWLPRAKVCTADIYFEQNVKAMNETMGSTTYSVASTTDAAAGNRYEEDVYAVPGSKPCTAVRYFIHYGAIENYPAGAVQPYDDASLRAAFDSIRDSLVLTPATTQ